MGRFLPIENSNDDIKKINDLEGGKTAAYPKGKQQLILRKIAAYPKGNGPANTSLTTTHRISAPAVRLHFIRLICILSISMQVML